MTFVFKSRIYHLVVEESALAIFTANQEPIFCGSALALEKSCLPIARLALQVYHYSLVNKH